MAKAKNKTIETTASVTEFIASIPDQVKQADSFKLIEIMQQLSGCEPKMWGPSIIGFGSYHYKYESGREGDAPLIGFSPRKAAISLYLGCEFNGANELLSEFGKHKTGSGGCIYVKKLKDINMDVLKKMISRSLEYWKNK